MNTRPEVTLLVLGAALALGAGCSDDAAGTRARSGSAEEFASIAGGIDPDPTCDYACVSGEAGERMCSQSCPDGCLTLVLARTEVDGSNVSGVQHVAEFCPHDLPAPELAELTCRITYIDTPGGAGDCNVEFSADLCDLAYEACVDAQ